MNDVLEKPIAQFRSRGDGLVTLGPDMSRQIRILDDVFRTWGIDYGASEMVTPPLIRTDDLQNIDYFDSFPHLGLAVTPIAKPALDTVKDEVRCGSIPAACLCDSELMLPSAACYNVYFDMRGERLEGPRHITTVARCFRNEDYFDNLRRLRGFTMREIVCVGTAEQVTSFLASFRSRIEAFSRQIGLALVPKPATDPFFKKDGAKATMQALFPVKEEFLFEDDLAIASVNFHRNFFGERCDIEIGGKAAFSGCVAFGLERWLHALATAGIGTGALS